MKPGPNLKRGRLNRVGVLILRAGGMELKQIASALNLSFRGADYHWQAIKRLTGIRSDLRLGIYAATVPQERWTI